MENTLLTGRIIKILYRNGDYHICLVERDKSITDTVVIMDQNVNVGSNCELYGYWDNNSKYGKQFKCLTYIEKLPSTKEGFIGFLKSGAFKGIGPATAEKIGNFLGSDALIKLRENVDIILTVPNVKLKLLQLIKETWLQNNMKSQISILLQQYGVTGVNVTKIYEKFGEKSITVLKNNPYILIYNIKGIGFKQADTIALAMGVKPDSDLRICECIKFAVENNSTYGNCYLVKDEVITSVRELINVNDRLRITTILEGETSLKKMVINGEDRYYAKRIYNAENYVFTVLCEMLFDNTKYNKPDILNDETLSNEQKEAVIGSLTNKVSVLTGGPGCGKTYTTKTIINTLINSNKKFAICAPTGKAAMRSTEVIGQEAFTIHRLLEYNPYENCFNYNEYNKLDYDFILVEESSMIDIQLMSDLLKAIDNHTQVVFIGDKDQLSPVSAGSPFKDMIDCGVIPTYRLTKVFRQAMGSKIITYAHKINTGELVYIDNPIQNPSIWSGDVDCLFIDSDIKGTTKIIDEFSTLRYGYDILDTIVRLYTETITKNKKYTDIQILIPKRVGNLGITNVNKYIQDAINPIKNFTDQIIVKNKQFRLNDKVIHTQNNYVLGGGVFNGEIGRITHIDLAESRFIVEFANRSIEYMKKDMDDLELAYAITIHKSQGSEFDAVIIPLLSEYGIMLERSLIYTALTRAKKLAVFIGQRKSLAKAIFTVNSKKRQTSLSELLSQVSIVVE